MEQTDIRLSQCMIVKNEEKNIEKALSWGKGVVCEQIVVDTGSTDRTVELAEKMGAKVFHFVWKDDFSAAKNYAIEQASGNWIAFLDADESFSPKDVKKLMPVLAAADANSHAAIVRTKMAHLRRDGEVMAISSQDRLFRNDPRIRYRYRIHEQLHVPETEGWGFFDAQNDLLILHTGYGAEVDHPEKGARNIHLLEQEIEENPDSGILMYYLGDAYDMAGREEEALEWYRRGFWDNSVDTSDGLSRLRCGLQILQLRLNEPLEATKEEVFQVTAKLRELGYGMHPDPDFYEGAWYYRARQLDRAAASFENALEKFELYQMRDVVKTANYLGLMHYVVAAAALQKGICAKAVQFAVVSLRLGCHPEDPRPILLGAFRLEWGRTKDDDREKRIAGYWSFLQDTCDMKQEQELLLWYKAAHQVQFDKLADRIRKAMPAELLEQLEQAERNRDDQQGL